MRKVTVTRQPASWDVLHRGPVPENGPGYIYRMKVYTGFDYERSSTNDDGTTEIITEELVLTANQLVSEELLREPHFERYIHDEFIRILSDLNYNKLKEFGVIDKGSKA